MLYLMFLKLILISSGFALLYKAGFDFVRSIAV